jgi:hypothetical protein
MGGRWWDAGVGAGDGVVHWRWFGKWREDGGAHLTRGMGTGPQGRGVDKATAGSEPLFGEQPAGTTPMQPSPTTERESMLERWRCSLRGLHVHVLNMMKMSRY